MDLKFYNSGICFSEISINENGVSHRIFDVLTSTWTEKSEDENLQDYYPIDIKRVTSKIKKAMEFDFSNAGNKFILDGEKYSIKESFDNVKIYCNREVQNPIDIVTSNDEFVGAIEVERNGCSVVVKPGYEDITPLKIWKEINSDKRRFSVKSKKQFKIPMEDGTNLNAFVWLPDNGNEKHSTILLRTPYGAMKYWQWLKKYVVRGYALVIQDVRGREESEGKWIPFHYEVQDGNDTLNFIAQQSWSNGKIGMIGASYSGGVQWAADTSGNSHLKAIVSLVTSGSPFGDIPRRGGAIFSGTMAWAFAMADKNMNSENMIRDDWDILLESLPIKDIPMKGLGKDVTFIKKWMEHENYDEFWEKSDWSSNPKPNDTPALIVSGWFDDDGMGSKEAWKLCNNQNRTDTKMILGPWLHNANTTRDINGIDFGNDAIRYDLDKIYLDWFDKHLEGLDNGIENIHTVQYYVCGENKWNFSDTWPPALSKETFLYLNKDDGCSFKSSEENYKRKYIYNPKNPTPFLIDVSLNECNVPANYNKVEERDDVVTFTSEPLEKELVISGELKARIYASSSCKDTDWIVRVTEVLDEDTSIRISDGVIRAKYREGFKEKKFMKADEIYKFEIDMFQAAHCFSRGSKIRISIMSGAKNLIFPNLNTGNDSASDTEIRIAEQTIYYGKDYPSGVYIPVVS